MSNETVFQPMGRRVEARADQDLLTLARWAGVGIEAACGGKGVCGKCKVKVDGAASPPTEQEKKHLGELVGDGFRLACQCAMPGGGKVWVPEESRPNKQVILTTGHRLELECEPNVRMHRLEVAPPTLEDPAAAAVRASRALPITEPRLPGGGLNWPISLLRALPGVLGRAGGKLSLAVADGARPVAAHAGHDAPALGMAVDLGTTTMVAFLVDLAQAKVLAVAADMNPQVRYGDDVISRISQSLADAQVRDHMRELIAAKLNQLAEKLCEQAQVEPELILECVLVGNTAMHHLALGLDCAGLAAAPFAPVAGAPLEFPARQAGLRLAPEALLTWLPVKAGFVGADAVAVALAVDAGRIQEPTLILDLGTNGEMILAVEGRLWSCSTAAGPAFEGGHIAWGMRGAPGAIERVEVEPGTLKPWLKVIGDGQPAGICGSGLVSAVAALLNAGALLPGGGYDGDLAGPHLRRGEGGWEYVLAPAETSGPGRDVVLTAGDVAELQLAKAAMSAGAAMMMSHAGVDRLERVLLAGAFGNYLDPADACRLGLFPGVTDPGLVQGVGNAAGAGALMALTSRRHRLAAAELAGRMRYLELSGHPDFQDLFVDGMMFPVGA